MANNILRLLDNLLSIISNHQVSRLLVLLPSLKQLSKKSLILICYSSRVYGVVASVSPVSVLDNKDYSRWQGDVQ